LLRSQRVRWLPYPTRIPAPSTEMIQHGSLPGLTAYLYAAPPPPVPATAAAAGPRHGPASVPVTSPDPAPEATPAPGATPATESLPTPPPPPPPSPAPVPAPEPDPAAVVRAAVERAADADLGADGRFTDGALTSLDMLRSVRALETVLGTLPKTLLFDHPDCTALAAHLVERFGLAAVLRLADTAPTTGTAPATDTDGSPRAAEPEPVPAPAGPAALVVPRSELADHPEL